MDGKTPEVQLSANGRLDLSPVTNPEALVFAKAWATQRDLNRDFYASVPDDKFEFRIAEGSPSTRENLEYQIKVHDNYLKGVREGELMHGKHYGELELGGLTKDELLVRLDEIDRGIIEFVSSSERSKQVIVPWSEEPVSAIGAFWGLKDHEIYHLGRNGMMAEAIGIPRSDDLKKVWG